MDQNYPNYQQPSSGPGYPVSPMIVTEEIRSYLLETAKWARMLSIVGFIGLGLMVLGALFTMIAGASMRAFGAGEMMGMSFIYLLFAVLYFFPIMYLYRAATGLRDGAQQGNQSSLTYGFANLKSHYKFVGILTIIVLSLYAVFALIGLIAVGLMH